MAIDYCCDRICILSKNTYFMFWQNLYFEWQYIAGPFNIEKYEAIIYDASGMRRYSRNMLQWRKIKTKSMNPTQWRLLIDLTCQTFYILSNQPTRHLHEGFQYERGIVRCPTQRVFRRRGPIRRNFVEKWSSLTCNWSEDGSCHAHSKSGLNHGWDSPSSSNTVFSKLRQITWLGVIIQK